jgi:hypothetical protein
MGDAFPSCSRQLWELEGKKQLPEWVVFLSLLIPLQVTPAAHSFILPASFIQQEVPLSSPAATARAGSPAGVQARATSTAVEVSLGIAREQWLALSCQSVLDQLVSGLSCLQLKSRRLAAEGRTW